MCKQPRTILIAVWWVTYILFISFSLYFYKQSCRPWVMAMDGGGFQSVQINTRNGNFTPGLAGLQQLVQCDFSRCSAAGQGEYTTFMACFNGGWKPLLHWFRSFKSAPARSNFITDMIWSGFLVNDSRPGHMTELTSPARFQRKNLFKIYFRAPALQSQ